MKREKSSYSFHDLFEQPVFDEAMKRSFYDYTLQREHDSEWFVKKVREQKMEDEKEVEVKDEEMEEAESEGDEEGEEEGGEEADDEGD